MQMITCMFCPHQDLATTVQYRRWPRVRRSAGFQTPSQVIMVVSHPWCTHIHVYVHSHTQRQVWNMHTFSHVLCIHIVTMSRELTAVCGSTRFSKNVILDYNVSKEDIDTQGQCYYTQLIQKYITSFAVFLFIQVFCYSMLLSRLNFTLKSSSLFNSESVITLSTFLCLLKIILL